MGGVWIFSGTTHYVIPENIHTHPMEGQQKFQGGGKFQKHNFGKYGTKVEFPEGVGVQAKKPSVRGVWIFSGTTH